MVTELWPGSATAEGQAGGAAASAVAAVDVAALSDTAGRGAAPESAAGSSRAAGIAGVADERTAAFAGLREVPIPRHCLLK